MPKAWDYVKVITGEPGTKSNSRRIVSRGKMKKLLKSEKTEAYIEDSWEPQIGEPLDPILEGDVAVRLDVWYASRRPDLAALELIKDLLEGIVYKNDRQVKAEMEVWNKDKNNPRVAIRVRKLPFDGMENITMHMSINELFGEPNED
jgi:Holliday junction resolvase RusA-like endonuclease